MTLENNIKKSVNDQSLDSDNESILFDSADFSENFLRKSLLINKAIDEIGFGRYQTGLFLVAGFGWFADNALPTATSYILLRLNEVVKVHYPLAVLQILLLHKIWGTYVERLFGLYQQM